MKKNLVQLPFSNICRFIILDSTRKSDFQVLGISRKKGLRLVEQSFSSFLAKFLAYLMIFQSAGSTLLNSVFAAKCLKFGKQIADYKVLVCLLSTYKKNCSSKLFSPNNHAIICVLLLHLHIMKCTHYYTYYKIFF